MLLRRAALALGSLVLVGSLAACDFPGGTPPQVSYDVEPNDTQQDARLVPAPGTVRGTVDESDTADYYEVTPPSEPGYLYIVCTGDISISMSISTPSVQQDASADALSSFCDGEVEPVGPVNSGSTIYVAAGLLFEGPSFAPYTFTFSFGPPPVEDES